MINFTTSEGRGLWVPPNNIRGVGGGFDGEGSVLFLVGHEKTVSLKDPVFRAVEKIRQYTEGMVCFKDEDGHGMLLSPRHVTHVTKDRHDPDLSVVHLEGSSMPVRVQAPIGQMSFLLTNRGVPRSQMPFVAPYPNPNKESSRGVVDLARKDEAPFFICAPGDEEETKG